MRSTFFASLVAAVASAQFIVPDTCFGSQSPVGGTSNVNGSSDVSDRDVLVSTDFTYDMSLSSVTGCVVRSDLVGLQLTLAGKDGSAEPLKLGFIGDTGDCTTLDLDGKNVTAVETFYDDYLSSLRLTFDDGTKAQFGTESNRDQTKTTDLSGDFQMVGVVGTQAKDKIQKLGFYVYNEECGRNAFIEYQNQITGNGPTVSAEDIPTTYVVPKDCYGASSVVGKATVEDNATVTDNKDYFLGEEFAKDSKLTSFTGCVDDEARLVGIQLGMASLSDYTNVVNLPSVGFVNDGLDCTTLDFDKDTVIDSMTVYSDQYVNSAIVSVSDGTKVIFGQSRTSLTDLETPWNFSNLGLIGLNGKAQQNKIHTVTSLVYNVGCIADATEAFETTRAEIEILVQETNEQQIAINAENAPAEAADNTMLYAGIGGGAVVVLIIIAVICMKKGGSKEGQAQRADTSSVEVISQRTADGPGKANPKPKGKIQDTQDNDGGSVHDLEFNVEQAKSGTGMSKVKNADYISAQRRASRANGRVKF